MLLILVIGFRNTVHPDAVGNDNIKLYCSIVQQAPLSKHMKLLKGAYEKIKNVRDTSVGRAGVWSIGEY